MKRDEEKRETTDGADGTEGRGERVNFPIRVLSRASRLIF